MDILFPPDLVPSTMMFGVDDFTAVDESATTGGMQSSALYGTRRWHLRMDFAVLSRANGKLARFEALTAALRGRSNRAWISPAGAAKLRGSFPAVEMFANNDFSSGVSPWASDPDYALSALDHGIRATRAAVTTAPDALSQAVTRAIGVPYAIRFFLNAGKGSPVPQIKDFSVAALGTAASQGMLETTYLSPITISQIGLFDGASPSTIAGNFFDAKWASFSRCAQVDNGVNLLLNSDTFSTSWSATAASVTANSATGPDGTVDAASFFETTANSTHSMQQSVTVPAAAADYTFSVFAAAFNRGFCWVQISDGSTSTSCYMNLTTGAITNVVTGGTWAAISAIPVSYGNGNWRLNLTARKTGASTTLTVFVGPATAAGTNSYVGVASPTIAIAVWRASLAQSSVPVQPIQTAGTAQAGTLQTGFNLNLKGLPVSTQGLLLEGDVVECLQPVNSQLLRVVSRLDSDAAGLGTLIFENALKQSPVDGAGVVVQQPMGRWVLASSTLGIEYTPGVFGQASLEFVEAA